MNKTAGGSGCLLTLVGALPRETGGYKPLLGPAVVRSRHFLPMRDTTRRGLTFLHTLQVLSLCALTACAVYKEQTAPPGEVLATPRKMVRLTLADGSQHTMNLARVEGDSVVGVHPRPTRTGQNTMSFPLADVRQVELGEISSARTQGLIIGVVGGLYLLWLSLVDLGG